MLCTAGGLLYCWHENSASASVADALCPTKAYSLPAVCEHYGLDPGASQEVFSSKPQYVMRRLERVTKMTNTTPALMLKAYPDDQHYI